MLQDTEAKEETENYFIISDTDATEETENYFIISDTDATEETEDPIILIKTDTTEKVNPFGMNAAERVKCPTIITETVPQMDEVILDQTQSSQLYNDNDLKDKSKKGDEIVEGRKLFNYLEVLTLIYISS